MQVRRFHHYLKGSFSKTHAKQTTEALASSGFIPLNGLVSKYIGEQFGWIEPLGQNEKPLAIRSEVYLNPELKHLIAYRDPNQAGRSARQGRREGVDYLIASESDDLGSLDKVFHDAIGGLSDAPLEAGSLQEKAIAASVEESLQKLSPNGRKLSDEPFLSECSKLENNDIRVDLQTLQRTFQDSPVTKDMIAKIEWFANRSDRLDALLANREVLDISFGAQCATCKDASIIFDSREACDTLIDSRPTCAECKKRDFEVVELYRCRSALAEAIQQGLWLEALALDGVRKRTSSVWAGYMAGSDEVDAIAVYADRVLLLECKDTSFGQNEFYVARAKAENVDATEICVLTTRDVHSNVQSVVKQANQNRQQYLRSRPRQYSLIVSPDASELRKGLDNELNRMDQAVIRNWFGGVYYPPYVFDMEFLD